MKVLITGIAGFIGSHLAERLLKENWEVFGIDDLSTGDIKRIPLHTIFLKADICNFKSLFYFIYNYEIDFIFHLAASARIQRSWDHPQETWQTNVQGTFNVLEAARLNKVKKVMITSSNSVYGAHGLTKQDYLMTEDLEKKPLNPYAYHKHLNEIQAEMFAKLYGMNIFVVRPFNVYGCHQPTHHEYSTVIPAFYKQWQENKPLTVYNDGQQSRDFTHVFDIVEGMFQLMRTVEGFDVYNLARGEAITIEALAKMFNCDYQKIPSPRQGEMFWTKGNSDKLYRKTNFRLEYDLIYFINNLINENKFNN